MAGDAGGGRAMKTAAGCTVTRVVIIMGSDHYGVGIRTPVWAITASGVNLTGFRPDADMPPVRRYRFRPSPGAIWRCAQMLPGFSTTPPGRYSRLPGWPGGACT